MSFSGEVKEELVKLTNDARHCQLAELAVILVYAGAIRTDTSGAARIELQSDAPYVAARCSMLFARLFHFPQPAGESGNSLAYGGIACLLASALLTAIYMLTVVVRGFFPAGEAGSKELGQVRDPNWKMLLPLFVFTGFIVLFGLYSGPVVKFFADVAAGIY